VGRVVEEKTTEGISHTAVLPFYSFRSPAQGIWVAKYAVHEIGLAENESGRDT